VITMLGDFAAVAYTDALQSCVLIFGEAVMLLIGLSKWEAGTPWWNAQTGQ